MVTMTSAVRATSSDQGLGYSVEMSIPASAMASMAAALVWSAGSEPPENTSTESPARCRSQPAAIWDRPALCTQRNGTANSWPRRRAAVLTCRCCSGVRVPGVSVAIGLLPGVVVMVEMGEGGDALVELGEGGVEGAPGTVLDRVGDRPVQPPVAWRQFLVGAVAHGDDDIGLEVVVRQ